MSREPSYIDVPYIVAVPSSLISDIGITEATAIFPEQQLTEKFREHTFDLGVAEIKEIGIINFDHQDVIRHPLVTKIVEAYQKNSDDKG